VLAENTNVWNLPVDANTGKARGEIGRLTESADSDIGPSISTDGRELAFTRGRSNLWLRDLKERKESFLAAATGSSQISADGSTVVFAKAENQQTALYVMRPTEATGRGMPGLWCAERLGTRWEEILD